MEYAISALWITLEYLSILLFFGAFLHPKSKKHRYVFCTVAWIVIFAANNFTATQPYSPIIRYSVIYVVSSYLFYGSWYIQIFLEVVIVLLLLILDTVISYGTSFVLGMTLNQLILDRFTYASVGTVGKFIVLLCTWLLYCHRTSHGFTGVHKKWFFLMLLFPAISVVIIVLNYYNNVESENALGGVFLISIVLALSNFGIVYLIHTLEEATIKEQEMALLKQQMINQRENYSALEHNYVLQRKSTHEFERHLQTLSELMHQNQYDIAQEYVLQLQKNRLLRVYNVKTGHPVIDVILNQKYQIAREKGIIMEIKVNDLSAIKVEADDLVVLLSNLLDNSIEACQRLSSQKEICCSMLYNDGLYISIRNTSLPVKITNGCIVSDKPSSIEHGYGLPAIKYVLDKLNAEYAFEWENGWFHFVTDISF